MSTLRKSPFLLVRMFNIQYRYIVVREKCCGCAKKMWRGKIYILLFLSLQGTVLEHANSYLIELFNFFYIIIIKQALILQCKAQMNPWGFWSSNEIEQMNIIRTKFKKKWRLQKLAFSRRINGSMALQIFQNFIIFFGILGMI